MKIRITSDTHNEMFYSEDLAEHFEYFLPRLDTDAESILVLAGDIWNYSRHASYTDFIDYIKESFKAIVNIAGNHEWYGGTYPDSQVNFKNYIKDIPNFHLLHGGETVTIDDVVFIGATLWTDYHKNDNEAKYEAKRFMNDFRLIRHGKKSLFTPEMAYSIHNIELSAIQLLLEQHQHSKRVVVTHHGPSYQSIHPKYANAGATNYSFSSDLDATLIKYQPEVWIHGHTHTSFKYNILNTEVIVNPVGYKSRYSGRYENPEYDPKLVIEI